MKAQLSLFFAAVVLFMAAYGQSGDSSKVYCGRSLANMMAALCYTNYEKRSGHNSIHLGYGSEYSWPWLSRGLQRHVPEKGLAREMDRGKRGIIEDCCDQSCSIETLMMYC